MPQVNLCSTDWLKQGNPMPEAGISAGGGLLFVCAICGGLTQARLTHDVDSTLIKYNEEGDLLTGTERRYYLGKPAYDLHDGPEEAYQ